MVRRTLAGIIAQEISNSGIIECQLNTINNRLQYTLSSCTFAPFNSILLNNIFSSDLCDTPKTYL